MKPQPNLPRALGPRSGHEGDTEHTPLCHTRPHLWQSHARLAAGGALGSTEGNNEAPQSPTDTSRGQKREPRFHLLLGRHPSFATDEESFNGYDAESSRGTAPAVPAAICLLGGGQAELCLCIASRLLLLPLSSTYCRCNASQLQSKIGNAYS